MQKEYGIKLSKLEDVTDVDAVIFAVPLIGTNRWAIPEILKDYLVGSSLLPP